MFVHHRLAFERALSLDHLCTGAMTGLAILELNSKKVSMDEDCCVIKIVSDDSTYCDVIIKHYLNTTGSWKVMEYVSNTLSESKKIKS